MRELLQRKKRKGARERSRLHAVVASLAVAALVLAACGGGEEAADEVPPAPEPTQEAAPEPEPEPEGPPFYEGQTITIVAPTSEGGSVDTTTRFIAEYLSRHLDGSPTVVVENIPGGNQLIGANDFARRDADGLTLFVNGTATNLAHILRHPDAEFDYAEMDAFIAFPIGMVVMSEAASGVEDASQLMDATGDLIYGCLRPSGSDLSRLLAFYILGIEEYRAVCGYESNTALRLAIEQGEVTLNADATAQYLQNLADADNVFPLFTLGQIDAAGEIVRDPAMPELPVLAEVYEMLYNQPIPDSDAWRAYQMAVAVGTSLSNTLWINSDAPQEAKDAINVAIERMLEDPDFAVGIDEIQAGYWPLVGDELEGALSSILAPDETIVAWIRQWLLDEFDHEI